MHESYAGQQARLQQGAKAWHTPIQVDGLPKLYRQWLRKAMSTAPEKPIDYDDYAVVLASSGSESADDTKRAIGKRPGPWFLGWVNFH
jgi:hypothetical protein